MPGAAPGMGGGSNTSYGNARAMSIMPPRVIDIALHNSLRPGEPIATLVSLSLTPLLLDEILAVHLDGERVYAASANGGVWYSGDAGMNWRSLDGLADTPGAAAIDHQRWGDP